MMIETERVEHRDREEQKGAEKNLDLVRFFFCSRTTCQNKLNKSTNVQIKKTFNQSQTNADTLGKIQTSDKFRLKSDSSDKFRKEFCQIQKNTDKFGKSDKFWHLKNLIKIGFEAKSDKFRKIQTNSEKSDKFRQKFGQLQTKLQTRNQINSDKFRQIRHIRKNRPNSGIKKIRHSENVAAFFRKLLKIQQNSDTKNQTNSGKIPNRQDFV